MSKIIGGVVAALLFVIPILLIIVIIRAIGKRSVKKWGIAVAICVGSILPLTILGVLTDPATWCEHEYDIVKEVGATCVENGETHKHCSICEDDDIEYVDAVGHSMKETSRIEPTTSSEGEIIFCCERCSYEEKEVLTKLDDALESGDDSYVSGDNETDPADKEGTKNEIITSTPVDIATDWKTVFIENGFTEDEVSTYEKMFNNVGITNFHDVEIIENGIMHIVRGKIFDSEILQLNVTLENREIILIELAGIPDKETDAYINWRGKLKFRTVQSKKSIDLYYDMDGGYVAKLDWENKMITPFEE